MKVYAYACSYGGGGQGDISPLDLIFDSPRNLENLENWNEISYENNLLDLHLQRKAFIAIYEMVVAAEVFGCSSVVCESTFLLFN